MEKLFKLALKCFSCWELILYYVHEKKSPFKYELAIQENL